MKSKRTTIAGLFVAGLLACTIAFSFFLEPAFLFSVNEVTTFTKEASVSINDTDASISPSPLSFSSFSLPAAFIVQTHLPSNFLFEIFAKDWDCDEVDDSPETPLVSNIVFKITLSVIIWPNAP